MAKQSEVDQKYQKCVDDLALDTLRLTRENLIDYSDYGSLERDGIGVAYWHHRFASGKHHIVFLTDRRLTRFFPIYRKYTAGIVFGEATDPRLMTELETADYD